MRSCPDDLAVLSYLELSAHLAVCSSCALLIDRLRPADELPPEPTRPPIARCVIAPTSPKARGE